MKCEISSRKILPAIRRALVMELVKTGKKQNEIARMLSVTPAAVTQYVKGKRAKLDLTADEMKKVTQLAEFGIKNGKIDEDRICGLCDQMRERLV